MVKMLDIKPRTTRHMQFLYHTGKKHSLEMFLEFLNCEIITSINDRQYREKTTHCKFQYYVFYLSVGYAKVIREIFNP